MRFDLAALAAMAVLASCGHQGQEGSLPMSRPDNAGPSATVPAGSASAVEAAKADAAARTGIAAAAWQVTRLEAVQWSDASLGCPKPDQMYAAVLTPGFLIELTAQGRVLVYHSGPNNRVVYCP